MVYVYGDKIKYKCNTCKNESYYKTQEEGRPCGNDCRGTMVIL